MEIIDQSYIIEDLPNDILTKLERIGRTCYRSEDKITPTSAPKFVRGIVKRDHLAIVEHASITVRFITDRAVSHELVRHRMASYAMESQRYVCYSGKSMQFIKPIGITDVQLSTWLTAMLTAKGLYDRMIAEGAKPELARAVLPNSVATEIVVTANLREWLHIFKLRTAPTAQPQMVALMTPLYQELQLILPEVFAFDL